MGHGALGRGIDKGLAVVSERHMHIGKTCGTAMESLLCIALSHDQVDDVCILSVLNRCFVRWETGGTLTGWL